MFTNLSPMRFIILGIYRNLGGSSLESPQNRAISYIHKITLTRVNSRRSQTKLVTGIVPSTYKFHLVYWLKNAMTDMSEPISRFGYVRDSRYGAAKLAVGDSIYWDQLWENVDDYEFWRMNAKGGLGGRRGKWTFRPTSILSTISVPPTEYPTYSRDRPIQS